MKSFKCCTFCLAFLFCVPKPKTKFTFVKLKHVLKNLKKTLCWEIDQKYTKVNVQYLIPIFSPRTVPSSCTQFAFLRFSNTRRMEYGNKKPRTRANLCIKRRVGKSLFCFSLFCSKSLSLNSDCEGFALVTLYKRVTVSNSPCHSLKKSEIVIHSFAYKKRSIHSKNQRANSQPWWRVWRKDCTVDIFFFRNFVRHMQLKLGMLGEYLYFELPYVGWRGEQG